MILPPRAKFGLVTPWSRNGLLAAGLRRNELPVPAGYTLHGSARSSRGPFKFTLTPGDHVVEARDWAGIPAALERLFGMVAA